MVPGFEPARELDQPHVACRQLAFGMELSCTHGVDEDECRGNAARWLQGRNVRPGDAGEDTVLVEGGIDPRRVPNAPLIDQPSDDGQGFGASAESRTRDADPRIWILFPPRFR